ncbi:hypothetical protein Fcan01_12071 [Folsomia candida]|uniref:Uncharacterized protein n=1 Tax=Folsomia candida TaxID=158441 RepID=A0A226E5Z0_FOLCA|nr:hypothetical protein Fcan01_12071 [Folsomia candida]
MSCPNVHTSEGDLTPMEASIILTDAELHLPSKASLRGTERHVSSALCCSGNGGAPTFPTEPPKNCVRNLELWCPATIINKSLKHTVPSNRESNEPDLKKRVTFILSEGTTLPTDYPVFSFTLKAVCIADGRLGDPEVPEPKPLRA